jgi:hypothetical protein
MGVVEKLKEAITCKHLRLREPRHSREQMEETETVNGVYWCDCTRDTLGPDGDEVEEEECTTLRSCFESSEAVG